MAREKVGALVILVFSASYGLLATQIPLSYLAQQEMFTARTMPYGLSAAGIILALAIILMPTVDPSGKISLSETTRGMDWATAILLVALMLVFGLVIKWLGFIVSSTLFLMGGFRALGERRIRRMLLAAVPLVLLLWCIMSVLLGVYIAPGEIFYQLGVL